MNETAKTAGSQTPSRRTPAVRSRSLIGSGLSRKMEPILATLTARSDSDRTLLGLVRIGNLQCFRADGRDHVSSTSINCARGSSVEEPAIEGAVLRLRPIMMTQTLVHNTRSRETANYPEKLTERNFRIPHFPPVSLSRHALRSSGNPKTLNYPASRFDAMTDLLTGAGSMSDCGGQLVR
jgi:hypothetical protein